MPQSFLWKNQNTTSNEAGKTKIELNRIVENEYKTTITSETQICFDNFGANSWSNRFETHKIKFPYVDVLWWLVFRVSEDYSKVKAYDYNNGNPLKYYTPVFNVTTPDNFVGAVFSFNASIKGEKLFSSKEFFTKSGCSKEMTANSIHSENIRGPLKLDVKIMMTFTETFKVDGNMIFNKIKAEKESKIDLKSLYDDPEFADFTFEVHEREFKVHKCILAKESEVFRKMFTTEMIEKESAKCAIEDIEADTFELLLKYIYTHEVEELDVEKLKKLFEAAHYYQVDQLLEFCKPQLKVKLKKSLSIENAVEIYSFAYKYDLAELIHDSWIFIKLEILKMCHLISPMKSPIPVEKLLLIIEKQNEIEGMLKEFIK
jgi:hypothetical protein